MGTGEGGAAPTSSMGTDGARATIFLGSGVESDQLHMDSVTRATSSIGSERQERLGLLMDKQWGHFF
jgi:hypothetical protein